MRVERSANFPFSCHGVEFSPFDGERVAVATAQYFGIVGNGRLHVLDCRGNPANGEIHEVRWFDTQAGLFDCAWSECHPRQLATAGADGTVKLWDLETTDGFPVVNWTEHLQEVSGVEWNLVNKNVLVSASWDGSVRLWSPGATTSLRVLDIHGRHPVYGAAWSPFSGCQLLSYSGDGTARVLDTNAPGAGVVVFGAHGGREVLSGDWDKYRSYAVATGCADGTLRTWDIRWPSQAVTVSQKHPYAVRRLRFSPHATGILATGSYDMTVMLWDTTTNVAHTDNYRSHNPTGVVSDVSSHVFNNNGRHVPDRAGYPVTTAARTGTAGPTTGGVRVVGRFVGHTEFVGGVAFSLSDPGLLVSCGWDQRLNFWRWSRR